MIWTQNTRQSNSENEPLSATHPLAEPASLPVDRIEECPLLQASANDNQPEQEGAIPDRGHSGDWPILALLVTGGALTVGWSGALVWGLWKFVAFVVL